MVLTEEQQRLDRITRLRTHAEIKRTTAVSAIRAVHALSSRALTESDFVPAFLMSATDLDGLWAQFKSEDESVLEYLVSLDRTDDYSPELPTEVRGLINVSKAVAVKLTRKGADVIDMSYINKKTASQGDGEHSVSSLIDKDTPKPLSRLPDIPLPQFDGDFRYWPSFRDLFVALVDQRANLCATDKLHYLIGCLKGPAADAVRGITVCAENYALVWSTLSNRFNRPRLVATSLVDKLLRASPVTQESLTELNNFMCLFSEGISLLDALKIPNMGSFILFSVAFRCLPMSTRKLFETNTKSDYPSIVELMEFLQQRVAVLEIVGQPRTKTASLTQIKSSHHSSQFRRGGDRSGKPTFSHPSTLVASKTNASRSQSCPCCNATHNLGACSRFKGWSGDERSRWTREKGLCFNCFSNEHWAPKCNSKARCQDCSRRHHHLLHPPANISHENSGPSSSETVLCASASPQRVNASPLVLLGTALIHIRDRAGSWQTMRAL